MSAAGGLHGLASAARRRRAAILVALALPFILAAAALAWRVADVSRLASALVVLVLGAAALLGDERHWRLLEAALGGRAAGAIYHPHLSTAPAPESASHGVGRTLIHL